VPRRMRLLVISANQCSIWFSQDELVGVKCTWYRECDADHFFTSGCLGVPSFYWSKHRKVALLSCVPHAASGGMRLPRIGVPSETDASGWEVRHLSPRRAARTR
jgi:hypothetical protein